MTECKAIEGARKPTVDVLVTDFARQCDMVRANCKRIVELKPTATSDAPNPISLRKPTSDERVFSVPIVSPATETKISDDLDINTLLQDCNCGFLHLRAVARSIRAAATEDKVQIQSRRERNDIAIRDVYSAQYERDQLKRHINDEMNATPNYSDRLGMISEADYLDAVPSARLLDAHQLMLARLHHELSTRTTLVGQVREKEMRLKLVCSDRFKEQDRLAKMHAAMQTFKTIVKPALDVLRPALTADFLAPTPVPPSRPRTSNLLSLSRARTLTSVSPSKLPKSGVPVTATTMKTSVQRAAATPV